MEERTVAQMDLILSDPSHHGRSPKWEFQLNCNELRKLIEEQVIITRKQTKLLTEQKHLTEKIPPWILINKGFQFVFQ